MKIKYKSGVSLLTLFILVFFSGSTQAQTIAPQVGAYYGSYGSNGMQQTHEFHEVIYVDPNGSPINLPLPSRTATSPHNYHRWYNFETNLNSPNLQPKGTYYTNGYADYGSTGLDNITYNINSSALPELIACDVSAYRDYTLVNNRITQEPTLSYRTLYDIRDGNELAQRLQEVTLANKYLQESTVYVPANPASIHQFPRVTLQYEREYYFGYDGNNNLIRSSGFNITGTSYSSFSDPFIFINTNNVSAGDTDEILVTMTVGSGANARTYNVAKFNIEFIAEAPQPFTTTGYRSVEYLDANFYLLGQLDLDFDTQPATAANNMWSTPLPADICEYGFVSEKLFNAGLREFDNKVSQWNEYGFYKTANVSLDGLTGYNWYNGGKQVYDRLHYISGGTQQGYFMYIDAAQSPGVIAKLPIANLCAGTKLYVSGAIASLTTSGQASYPDVNAVFYGIEADGTQVELNRYTSGDIPTDNTNPTPWYQIYYSFTFTENVDYVSYILQLENNCTGTYGGDYAIDDLRIYRSKPSVQAYQQELPCGEQGAKVKVRVEYDKLLSSLGASEVTDPQDATIVGLKYKALNEDYSDVDYNYGTEANPNFEFGEIGVSTRFADMNVLAPGQDPPIATDDIDVIAYTETETVDGTTYRYVVFLLPNTNTLTQQGSYRAVVADGQGVFDTGICALISDPFTIIPSSSITVDGSSWTEGDGLCYGNTLIIGVTLNDRNGVYTGIEALFDWYYGTVAEYEAVVPAYGISVRQALEVYRSEYPAPNENDGLSTVYTGSYTEEIHDLLQEQIDEGKLTLNQATITRVIRQADVILALPLIETADLSSGVDITDLCSDIIVINTNGPASNPTLQLGNSEFFTSLRMGLAQYEDLQQNSLKTITIPIYDFRDSDGNQTRPLTTSTDLNVYLIDTDDPTVSVDPADETTFIAVAQVNSITATGTADDRVVLSIRSGNGFTVREGYTYTFEFYFNEQTGISEPPACDGTGILTIKVVPEYLTWTGAEGDNWNNDTNWRRSTQDELYKTDYTDDPDSHGFVPLDFSKTTIPATNGTTITQFPWLYQLSGSPFLNLDNTNYTDAGDKLANAATDSIQYDLILKANGSNYDCENFYGNTADQIYFKPRAEMRNTQYLTYNKAYIDFELASGRWYMLSSPLKDVYAGDMYLPTASGRQETEAFVPITFTPSLHNRFDPPVYQRSWDHANSTVFRQDGTTEDAYIATNWSQVYNKVDELYDQGMGFSIRPVFGTVGTDTVLFRLPKEDTEYLYYTYDGLQTGDLTSVSRTENGRLILENQVSQITVPLSNQTASNLVFLVGNPFMATLDMAKFFDTNTNLERKYWIITNGNVSAVQIETDGTVISTGAESLDGTVVPLQSFFVEKTTGSAPNSVTFTPDMTVAVGNSEQILLKHAIRTRSFTGSPLKRSQDLRVKATRGNDSSEILIRKAEGATNGFDTQEDVQVIMDSNLENIPMLYTMAGTQAVMINTLSDPQIIPLGIFSNNEEEVRLTFSGLSQWNESLYLYDRLLEQAVEITESDSSVLIPGRTHDRYFLRMSAGSDLLAEQNPIQVQILTDGCIRVYSNSSDPLRQARIYNLNGILLKEMNAINHSVVEMELPTDQFYILRISSEQHTLSTKLYLP